MVAIVGVGYFCLVILALSLFSTQYSPVTQFASDYGVGAFGTEMNAGFMLAGAGFVSTGLVALYSGSRVSKVGGTLLVLDGLCLVASGLYQTDIEGAAATFHGQIHNAAGVSFFLTAPLGLLLVSRGFGGMQFVLTVLAVLVAAAFAVANGVLALSASGLAERLVILVVFSSLIVTSVRFLREP